VLGHSLARLAVLPVGRMPPGQATQHAALTLTLGRLLVAAAKVRIKQKGYCSANPAS
jgi:hypothetical protein